MRKNKKLPSPIGTRVYSRVATQLAFRPSSVAVSGEPVKFIICRSGAERLVTLPTCTDRRFSEKVSDLLLPLCVSFITCFKVYELSGTVSRKYIIDCYCIRRLKTNIFVIYTFLVFLCILYLSYSSFLSYGGISWLIHYPTYPMLTTLSSRTLTKKRCTITTINTTKPTSTI